MNLFTTGGKPIFTENKYCESIEAEFDDDISITPDASAGRLDLINMTNLIHPINLLSSNN